MSAELDAVIREKRSQLKDAFVAYQKAREAVARAYSLLLSGIESEPLAEARAEIQRLETDEREAANRFNAMSGELAELHRAKYGQWHVTWRGPRPAR